MATCRDIITRAYRMIGVVGLSRQPTGAEFEAGLGVLQSIYDRIAQERSYTAIKTTGDVEAGENQRIITTGTVTLPAEVVDEVDGQPRAPIDLAFVQYDAGLGWMTFVSDRGQWVSLDNLEDGDEAPLSSRNQEGLSSLVAMELYETYPGAALGQMTMQKARRFQGQFSRDTAQEPEYF